MIRIGIICPSEIAFRRFMPALMQNKELEYVGVAYATKEEWFGKNSVDDEEKAQMIIKSEREKASRFQECYGGKVFFGYESMLVSKEIDAVYIPLPPALHYKWAKLALECGLHVFVEKPSTTSLKDTTALVEMAKERKLALHENYMFAFHSQLEAISRVVKSGEIGKPWLYRIDFGFPKRPAGDFRYVKKLGGGALLDCGGYTLKYANMLLGGNAKVISANVNYSDEYDVEIFGAGTVCNEEGTLVQLAFGMDNDYRCDINIWGSTGTLKSNRILTAPAGFEPSYSISKNGVSEEIKMEADDTFLKSMNRFVACVKDEDTRMNNYEEIAWQEKLVDEFVRLAQMK